MSVLRLTVVSAFYSKFESLSQLVLNVEDALFWRYLFVFDLSNFIIVNDVTFELEIE